jgi:MoxR-like ATPase
MSNPMSNPSRQEAELERFRADFDALRREIGKRVVGQAEAVESVLTAMLVGGHVLLESPPGLGKTLLARTLADVVDLTFRRIQCTPDLMPADVIGTYVIMESPQGRRTFEFQKGPLFANLVLADQLNRTTPKTQSALLEAMEEDAITVSTESFPLPRPYLVVATQNPWEMEGTFPLAEAQIDRFLLKAVLKPPSPDELKEILGRTTEPPQIRPRKIVDGRRILEMADLVRRVAMSGQLSQWVVSVIAASQPEEASAPEPVRRFVRHGASPRGAQAMVLAAKVRAILAGRDEVAMEDLRAAAYPALRHRVILNFEGVAERVSPDALVDSILGAHGLAR